jgi:hypothetical protein
MDAIRTRQVRGFAPALLSAVNAALPRTRAVRAQILALLRAKYVLEQAAARHHAPGRTAVRMDAAVHAAPAMEDSPAIQEPAGAHVPQQSPVRAEIVALTAAASPADHLTVALVSTAITGSAKAVL